MEPIRSEAKVKKLIEHVLEYGLKRDSILILFALNTLLRINDILDLKYENVFDKNGNVKEYIDIIEKKSVNKIDNPERPLKRKTQRIKLSKDFKIELKRYSEEMEMEPGDYLFYSTDDPTTHMHRKTAWRRMSKYGKAVGIKLVGCHGLRKTGAYQMRMKGIPIAIISKMLGHTSEAQTRKYIGIDQDEVDRAVEEVNFSFNRILKEY